MRLIDFPIHTRVYDETLDLLYEARSYCAYKLKIDIEPFSLIERLRLNNQAMLVTSRLAWVVGWWAEHKAEENGEELIPLMSAEEEDELYDILSKEGIRNVEVYPRGLRSLLARSESLFNRVRRI